jgi:very-long-chain enoyl-CoA reductase
MPKTLPGKPHDLLSYTGALVLTIVVAGSRMVSSGVATPVFTLGTLALILWCSHFSRRIVECLAVHRYAGRRVPLGDALGEYAYYWGFGTWNAWAFATHSQSSIDSLGYLGLATFVLGELGNAWSHLRLRALRRPDTNERGIPTGGLFEWVSCANYSYEILTWCGFALVMRNLPSLVFLGAIIPILAGWAKKRHARYHVLFDGHDGRPLYPTRRKALVPWLFLLV